ncbi:MAG: M1 family metallopeptidase [Chitinophagaceae bacterium]|nr:M1 family metallopeptidase [Chitinophagaceae bacterium]MCB9046139.1 M1 family metallopeptidase [Chitinophagales bacterium]
MRYLALYTMLFLWYLLPANTTFAYTSQDSLRGSNTNGRNWWDVKEYYLYVSFDTAQKSISGMNIMTIIKADVVPDSMQVDLQEPMMLDSAVYEKKKIKIARDGNVYWLIHDFGKWDGNKEHKIELYYHGKPRQAKLPPWDGGFVWTKDSTGKPWIAVACQGLGASSWWPCKDYQGDEPDNGMTMNLYVPYGLITISNGKFADRQDTKDSTYSLWVWRVKNPINTYDATFYIGDYAGWPDTIKGEKGILDLGFFPLKYHEKVAREHFKVTKQMLHCFEYWMGPYPFYEDGYKLVEAPYLGMEHQSAVAYGNEYKMGYRGEDRSGSGVGLLFDFIIVHESGHEWFGNSITAQDIADNWLHEGFTTYTEALFAECAFGKDKAFQYARGEWKNILNQSPVIGKYGIQDEGSPDKYDKGAAVVHMIRVMMNDDEQFRQLLRGLNKDFYHKIVTSKQVEQYIMDKTGLKLDKFFDQYLRSKNIPVLEWYVNKKEKKLYCRFTNVVAGFSLPLNVKGGKLDLPIIVSDNWQSVGWKKGGYNVSFSKDFLIEPKP